MMVNSEVNNKTLAKLNDKLSEILNDMCILASYLLSPLSKNTNLELTIQFKLIKDPDSGRVNDLLIIKTIQVTLYDNLLTFLNTDKEFELEGNLSKLITNIT